MNYAIVFRLLGYVMLIEGALLLLPAAASWIYGEWFVLGVFLITAAVSAAIGYALRGIKPQSKVFYMREGFAATSLSWIVISIVGAVPFVVAGRLNIRFGHCTSCLFDNSSVKLCKARHAVPFVP